MFSSLYFFDIGASLSQYSDSEIEQYFKNQAVILSCVLIFVAMALCVNMFVGFTSVFYSLLQGLWVRQTMWLGGEIPTNVFGVRGLSVLHQVSRSVGLLCCVIPRVH